MIIQHTPQNPIRSNDPISSWLKKPNYYYSCSIYAMLLYERILLWWRKFTALWPAYVVFHFFTHTHTLIIIKYNDEIQYSKNKKKNEILKLKFLYSCFSDFCVQVCVCTSKAHWDSIQFNSIFFSWLHFFLSKVVVV